MQSSYHSTKAEHLSQWVRSESEGPVVTGLLLRLKLLTLTLTLTLALMAHVLAMLRVSSLRGSVKRSAKVIIWRRFGFTLGLRM